MESWRHRQSGWQEAPTAQRKRRFFSPEFKAQAVDLVHQSGKGVKQIAQALDVTETCPRDWVKNAGAGRRGRRRNSHLGYQAPAGFEEPIDSPIREAA